MEMVLANTYMLAYNKQALDEDDLPEKKDHEGKLGSSLFIGLVFVLFLVMEISMYLYQALSIVTIDFWGVLWQRQ